jgi:transcription-repair coupling factor (superfamily II helicase)
MSDFNSLVNKTNELFNNSSFVKLSGIDDNLWSFIYQNFFKSNSTFDTNDVYICKSEDQAEELYNRVIKSNYRVLYIPGYGEGSYTSIIQSESALFHRYNSLQKLVNNSDTSQRTIIILSYQSLFMKLPPVSHFKDSTIKVEISDIISPADLALKLSSIGYQSTPTVEEPGTFTKKGEIFDIYPLDSNPIRIHYFDDMIEEIFEIDVETLKTKKDKVIESINLSKSPYGIIDDITSLNLRSQLSKFPIPHKSKNEIRNGLFEKLSSNMLFDNYPLFFQLFFKSSSNILEYLDENYSFHFFDKDEAEKNFNIDLEQIHQNYSENLSDETASDIFPDPNLLFFSNMDYSKYKSFIINDLNVELDLDLENNISKSINFYIEPTNIFFRKYFQGNSEDKIDFIKNLINTIFSIVKDKGHLYVLYKHDSTKDQINYFLNENLPSNFCNSNVTFLKTSLAKGFYYPNENLFFLSESDLFSEKTKKKKKKSTSKINQDLFAEQISTLKEGDYLIHKTHGVGKYLGMESIIMGGQENDYLVIQYTDKDKVYLPVYKLNLVQKHADNLNAIKVDSLKSKKFDTAKNKAKSSVKKLAFDLLELQAKRKTRKGFSFSAPDHMFKEFELNFPFEETPDQLTAIDDVLDDMQSSTPMDRLICGDVGFGKTEVAMRASFKAVLDKKQVAILVPTTVLAFQHYNSFIKRFADFPVNIEFISRFKTAKQVNKILENLKEGKVDIVIGTHKLLGNSIKFLDLGLVIIDEEQRFGVGHKEKLKLLKETVDSLVMTATPIPRTLQLSFLGIKELSLIRTAPPKRQSIKTYIIKDDGKTIRTAIEKELNRGGQVFIVHNRVKDIEEYALYIRKLVPNANIVIAHGQMPERELETKIKDFYEHKFDILISTTIIESGIDIPSANTMIIDRADMYGLSQLHQLRGRIGRSDKKAYAYFIIPSNRNLSTIAAKRLKALQTYADIGSGFNLATSDLEIRGSGDILGAEQSGHIANVGLELYMDLLKDAINYLKGENKHQNTNLEIQTPFAASIPNNYINDTGLRLKYYKRLSNTIALEDLEGIIDEINDQFGLAPEKVKNLYTILKSRIAVLNLGLISLKVQSKSIVLNFNKEELEADEYLCNKVVSFFMQRPKVYKFSPNFSVNCAFKEKITPETLLEFTNYIAQQIEAC